MLQVLCDRLASEYPCGHDLHSTSAETSLEYLPLSQGVQSVDLPTAPLNLPGRQSLHSEGWPALTSVLYLPLSQFKHVEASLPRTCEYLPARQAVHLDASEASAPTSDDHFPKAQATHCACFFAPLP